MESKKKHTQDIDSIRFSKAKILSMQRFHRSADLLGVLLEDNNRYTLQEVQKKISRFMKGSET